LWPQFRGPNRNGISEENVRLNRTWSAAGPRQLWAVELGEGYAGPAVRDGRVYLMDYDREKKQDALRCLSLADGQEIWRYAYPVPVKRNHGMSRTVPTVTDTMVVAMGPKCHVVCLDRITGELRWGLDLVKDFGATVPPWYAGQCPLVDGDAVILAPGGNNALLVAVDNATGSNRWVTPNPRGWRMTHTSIMAADIAGERMYVYCGHSGVVGVSARTGEILWDTTAWKISIATVPSPVVLEGGRIFLSGGYNAGSLMLQVRKDGERFVAQTLFKLEPEVFGATQQTPILYQEHLYGVRPDGKFTCLDLEGKPLWVSDAGQQFGLGPFILADGVFLAVNDSGLLRMIEASPAGYKLLAQAKVLTGRESWGPLAIAGGRLLARDLTRMVCLDLTSP
jgi:outer membrane protein assembly factor BamB